MGWNAQFIREIKALLVWGLIPFLGLTSILKVAWDWYIAGVLNVRDGLQLSISVIVVVACGYVARKKYCQWQAQVLAEATSIGSIVRVVSIGNSNGSILRLLVIVGLIATLAFFRPIAIAPMLILGCAAVMWWSFLSTFMASRQCVIGTQGLWTTFAGWKMSVPYSSVAQVNRQAVMDGAQARIALSMKEGFFGRVDLPMPLAPEVADALEKQIRVASPQGLQV